MKTISKLFLVDCFIVILSIIILSSCNNSTSNKNSTSNILEDLDKKQKERSAFIDSVENDAVAKLQPIQVAELFARYSDNPIRAENDYLNKVFPVTGIITNRRVEGSSITVVELGLNNSDYAICCYNLPDSIVSTLNNGDAVVIVGVCNKMMTGTIAF